MRCQLLNFAMVPKNTIENWPDENLSYKTAQILKLRTAVKCLAGASGEPLYFGRTLYQM